MKKRKIILAGFLSIMTAWSSLHPILFAQAKQNAVIDLNQGLAGHWEFDDVGTKTATNSGSFGNEWDGILDEGNTVRIQDSKDAYYGGVLHFDAKQNNVAKGMLIRGSTHKINTQKDNFSYSFWIKNTPGYTARSVVLQQTGSSPTLLNLETGGRYAVYMSKENDKYITSNTKDDEWNLITLTKENNLDHTKATVKGYVNGQLSQTIELDLAKFSSADSDLYVGRHKNAGEDIGQLQGDMDDLRYYTRAISESEVKAIYDLKAVDTLSKALTTKITEAKEILKKGGLAATHPATTALQSAIEKAEEALTSKDVTSIQQATNDLQNKIAVYQEAVSNPQEDINSGLIGHWTFDDVNAPLENEANHDYKATLTGDVSIKDKILHFNTTDSSKLTNISITKADDSGILNTATDDFTLSMLVKANGTPKMTLIQQSGNGRSLLYSKDGSYYTFINGKDERLGPSGKVNSWEHIIFSKIGKTLVFYVNGKKQQVVQLGENLVNETTKLLLGSHKSSTDTLFGGDLDQLRIYSRGINEQEAKLIYQESAPTIENQELEDAKASLYELITNAQAEYDKNQVADSERVRINLKQALVQANTAYETASTVASLQQAYDILQRAYNEYKDATTELTIYPDAAARTIDHGIFGINHRYGFNGYGSFDSNTMKMKDDFTKLYQKAGFGSLRYPGGTISNLFNWKETIGPKEQRVAQIHGFYNNSGQHGLVPNFGLSEVADFVQENDSELVYVYGLGRGDAKDAADLVEYLNAEVGDNPNGGIAWAQVRAKNGHKEPYNVRYFEIGNEMNQGGADGNASQQYWTAYVDGGSENAYINGGVAKFNKQYAVAKDDWNVTASYSNGRASQTFYMRYAREKEDKTAHYKYYYGADEAPYDAVNKGSVEVYVGNDQWSLVTKAEMEKQSSTAQVAWVDYMDGSIHFGDGTHGAIPQDGKQIKVSYTANRDGFVQVSQAIRDTMQQINSYHKTKKEQTKEMHIYTSYESNGFIEKMNKQGMNNLYDGMTIHPYSGTPAGGSGSETSREQFYYDAMRKGDDQANHVKSYVENMQKYDKSKVPVISEYGIFRSTDPMVRSQTHALYIARAIMDYVALGSPYIQKHCLVDWYSEGADSLGPTQQAVIQAVPVGSGDTQTGEGEFKFFATPSANVFEMLNSTFGDTTLSSKITNKQIQNKVNQYSVLSSKDAQGNIYAAIVNLNVDSSNTITLHVDGVDLHGKNMEILQTSGPTFYAENTLEHPDNVSIQRSETTIDGKTGRLTLAPHSFTVVKIKKALQGDVPVVSTSALEAMLKECENLQEHDYTKDTWQIFAAAYKQAQEALTSQDQIVIDTALQALKEAKAGLKIIVPYKPDTSKLEAAIANAIPKEDANKYTAVSWKYYQQALEKAQAVLANPTASQDELDDAYQVLLQAEKQLKKVPMRDSVVKPNGTNSSLNTDIGAQVPNTSDGIDTNLLTWLFFFSGTICSIYFYKKYTKKAKH